MDVYDPLVLGLFQIDVHCYVRTRPTDASTGIQQAVDILKLFNVFYYDFINVFFLTKFLS